MDFKTGQMGRQRSEIKSC